MTHRVVAHTLTNGEKQGCFIPSPLNLPTGIGDSQVVTPLRPIRRQLGLPQRYRAGLATLTGKRDTIVVGPPPEHIPACMRQLSQYMALRGDRHVKGWYATIYLLSVHPWSDGNGRTGREFYRRQTGSSETRDSLRGRLREALRRLQPRPPAP